MSSVFLVLSLMVCVVHGVPRNKSSLCSTTSPRGYDTKIVGGTRAFITEFPYQLRFKNLECSATLIQPDVALTSVICLDMAGPIQVVGGDLDMCEHEESTEQIREVKSVVIHPGYAKDTSAYDIAILILSEPFQICDAVKPIRLAPEGFDPTGQGIVTGWGQTKKHFWSCYLLKTDVIIFPDEECEMKDFYPKKFHPTMACAGDNGKGTCRGDSGGPLVAGRGSSGGNATKDPLLIGITSWGRGCGQVGQPWLFTEVSHFHGWISSTISP